MRPVHRPILAVLLVLAVIGSSCGGGSGVGTGDAGDLLAALPGGFPIPVSAEVGGGLTDAAAGRTEVELAVPLTFLGTLTFFTVELVNGGYVIDRSRESGEGWVIEFRQGSVRGSVTLTDGDGSTGAAITIVDP